MVHLILKLLTLSALACLLMAVGQGTLTTTGVGVLFVPSGGSGPLVPGLTQQEITAGTASTLTLNQSVSVGEIAIVWMWYGGGSSLTLTATDSLSNTYTTLSTPAQGNFSAGGDTMAVACAPITTGGADTVTFKNAGVATAMEAIVKIYHNATCTQDATLQAVHTASTTTCGTLSITPVTNNDLVLQGCGTTAIDTWVPGAGWYRQLGAFDQVGDGEVDSSDRVVYVAGTVSAGDSHGATAREVVGILVALKAATGSAPTTPSIDATCTSGNIVLSGSEVCGAFTISASAISLVVQTHMDTATITIDEVCLYPGANTYSTTCAAAGGIIGYFLGRTVLGSPQNTSEVWTFYKPPTGSSKIRAHWVSGADLSSFTAESLLGGTGAFAFSGSAAASGNASNTITSATNHFVVDGGMEGQNSTCQTAPVAGGSQTQVINFCNGSGNWYYFVSTEAGASSVTPTWTLTSPIGWVQNDVDAF